MFYRFSIHDYIGIRNKLENQPTDNTSNKMATTNRATMIRKEITAEMDKVTEIVDDITPEGLDMLEESIGKILTKHKEYQLTIRTEFGHLAMILTEEKYRDTINDQTFVYAALTDQGAYNPNAGNNTNSAQQGQ